MNKIVREHYPVEKLPEDLQAELVPGSTVTLTIEATELRSNQQPQRHGNISDLLERIQKLRASGVIKPVTSEEAVERIRSLRNEWN